MAAKNSSGKPVFIRKDNYSKDALDVVREVIKAGGKNGVPVLAVPNEDSIICYCGGLQLLEVRDDPEELEKIRKNYLNNPELGAVMKKVECGQKQDHERHTQQDIALRNLTLQRNVFSVCGFETKVSSAFFPDIAGGKSKKGEDINPSPEIDLVVFCPKEKKMLLVEYKCRNKALDIERGVIKHAKDYSLITERNSEIGFAAEMLKAYDMMRKIYNKPPCRVDPEDIETEILFLFTGTTVKDNGEDKDPERLTLQRINTEMKKLFLCNDSIALNNAKEHILWEWEQDYTKAVFDSKKFCG